MQKSQELHHKVTDALDGQIRNPNYFLWIVVEAAPTAEFGEQDAEALRQSVEHWLEGTDPDEVIEDRTHPRMEWEARDDLAVKLWALPKKPEARGTHQRIVGNPVPAVTFFAGS